MNDSDREMLHIDLDRLEVWAIENTMKINPGKSKSVSFTTVRVKDSLNYFFRGGGTKISGSESLQIFRNNRTQRSKAGLVRLFAQYKKPGRHFIS